MGILEYLEKTDVAANDTTNQLLSHAAIWIYYCIASRRKMDSSGEKYTETNNL